MLCLGRREGESIIVGDNMKLTLTRINSRRAVFFIEKDHGGKKTRQHYRGIVKGSDFKIEDDVKLTILSVSKNQVNFGIKAPHDVAVDREEIRLSKLKGEGNECN